MTARFFSSAGQRGNYATRPPSDKKTRGHRSREAIEKLDSELFAFEGCPSGKDEVVRIAQPV